jgi:hypothetical protein
MNKSAWWKWAMMVGGMLLVGLATLAAEPRGGIEADPALTTQGSSKNMYKGSSTCKNCHSNPDQSKQELPVQYFVKYDEYTTWQKLDKHSIAYQNLLDERGQRMARLLGIKDPTELKAGCIGCHGAGLAEAKDRVGSVLFKPEEGVSCENCHGPSSNWWGPHVEPSFRQTSTEDREKMGLIDLRLPKRQAEQCLSCHIGNSDGKVVTHEMYAAGHPPLPSIEVATFSDVIPRHWWLVGEKRSANLRKAVNFEEGTKEKTRLSLVGAAVALKTTMKLLADETKANGSTTVPGLAWPDYARFDCWSCHHDLKRESWRQVRGYQAAPGRPPISEWPKAIVELGISRLELDDPAAKTLRGELAGHQKAVLDEAYAKPYGRRVPMATAADQFASWLDVLIDRLAAAKYDDAVADKLLVKLVESAEDQTVDYDAARHIAWTIVILADDAGPKLGKHRPEVEAILKKFEVGLNLKLPAGRDYKIEDFLGKALDVIGDYEPAAFQKDLKELLAVLKLPKE